MRILIVKLSSFGDVIHTFPAITDLKVARPDVEIDWLVEEPLAPFARLHPGVAELHPLAFRRLRWPPSRWPSLAGAVAGLRRRLRARRYDLVVDLQGLIKSAVPARLAGAPVAGYDAPSAREPAASRLYRHRFAVPKELHAVERTRRLLAAAVGYSIPEALGRYGLATPPTLPADTGLPGRYGLIFHATSWPTKHWPEDHWRRLLERMAANDTMVALPWGNAEEKARAERLASGLGNAVVLSRIFSGTELAAVVAHADFAVGLDTGLMHLAAAYGVPGVSLFGPTDPARSGPYGENQLVIKSAYPKAPCFRRRCVDEPDGMCCMHAIPVEEVVAVLSGPTPAEPSQPRRGQ
jgi:heptosyltransferase-1